MRGDGDGVAYSSAQFAVVNGLMTVLNCPPASSKVHALSARSRGAWQAMAKPSVNRKHTRFTQCGVNNHNYRHPG